MPHVTMGWNDDIFLLCGMMQGLRNWNGLYEIAEEKLNVFNQGLDLLMTRS
jgi:hypothetical protein